jgi:hypothetical protein
MGPITPETAEQIKETYRRLVKEGKYAPAAPSDGFGTIIGEQDTEAEAEQYISQWWEQEDDQAYYLGCPDFLARPALIFAVEGASLICGMNYEASINLFKLAISELEGLKSAIWIDGGDDD